MKFSSTTVAPLESLQHCSISFPSGLGINQVPKSWILHTATNAASATMDYNKGMVDAGVVGSPLSRGLDKMCLSSPSSSRPIFTVSIRNRLVSPTQGVLAALQRRLYHGGSYGGLMNANENKQLTSRKHSPRVVQKPKTSGCTCGGVVFGSSFMPRYSCLDKILKAYR